MEARGDSTTIFDLPIELFDGIMGFAIEEDVATKVAASFVCHYFLDSVHRISPPTRRYRNSTLMCQEAARIGNLELLQWAKEELKCRWDAKTCAVVADYGHLEY